MSGEDREKVILEHQLEEWKYLNEYVNRMDLGYQQSITIVITVFGVIATVLTATKMEQLKWGIFIIPLGLMAVFAYMSYQFRITAILRGHLAAVERNMNKKLREDIHMWNSALVETFMVRNNPINNLMMLPILFFVALLVIYSIVMTWGLLKGQDYGELLFMVYWLIITVGIVIVFPPFLNNERIRIVTEDEETVIREYTKYLEERKNKKKKYKITDNPYADLNKILIGDKGKRVLISIGIGIVASIIGFGVLCVLWHFADKTLKLKGLFDYYAATIGDGICLPVLVAAGYYFWECNKELRTKLTFKERKRINLYSAIALVVGISVQISWIAKDNVELNWTLPKAHTFNLAGWYHAVYFVVMFFVVVRLITRSIFLYRKENCVGENSYILIWTAGLGYLYTHIIDDYLNMNNFHYIIFLVTAVVLVLFVFWGGKIESERKKLFSKDMIKLIIISIIMLSIVWTFCVISGLQWNVKELFGYINVFLK